MNAIISGKKLVKSAVAVAVIGAAFPATLGLGAGSASAACQGEVYGATSRITCSDSSAPSTSRILDRPVAL
jgi:hypothetical protein